MSRPYTPLALAITTANKAHLDPVWPMNYLKRTIVTFYGRNNDLIDVIYYFLFLCLDSEKCILPLILIRALKSCFRVYSEISLDVRSFWGFKQAPENKQLIFFDFDIKTATPTMLHLF